MPLLVNFNHVSTGVGDGAVSEAVSVERPPNN